MPVPWGKKAQAPPPQQQPIQPQQAAPPVEAQLPPQNQPPIMTGNMPPPNMQMQQPQYEDGVAIMEAKVKGDEPSQRKKVGRWTLAQLRQTDGMIPLQNGTNRYASQKLMTGFGTPRNTTTKVKSENLQEVPEEILKLGEAEVRPQSGSNKFASQRGMTGIGVGRDVVRESFKVQLNPNDLQPISEEKLMLTEGIVRLQSGTNRYASQKGMTGFGTARRELTHMLDTKHPDYDIQCSIDQSAIPLQSGTNKFASQRGMTGFGTTRRETTHMIDTKHPEYDAECSIDSTTIPSQMGSNKYASQAGMTNMGAFRLETLAPNLSRQTRKSQGIVPSQYGSNQFASQQGMIGFGTIRNTQLAIEAGDLPFDEIRKSEAIIRSQAGWNQGDSQKRMTSFGAPRDVKGKHLKRLWELEYPEEAEPPIGKL